MPKDDVVPEHTAKCSECGSIAPVSATGFYQLHTYGMSSSYCANSNMIVPEDIWQEILATKRKAS